jgi:hypothetical protein
VTHGGTTWRLSTWWKGERGRRKEWEHSPLSDLAPNQALAGIVLLLQCDKLGVGRCIVEEPSVDLLIDRCSPGARPKAREDGERVEDGADHA